MERSEALTAVAREILGNAAPEEVTLTPLLVEQYLSQKDPPSPVLASDEKEAGIGLAEGSFVLTYLLLPVLDSVLGGALDALREASYDTVKRLIEKYASRLRTDVESAFQERVDADKLSDADRGKYERLMDSLGAAGGDAGAR